MSGASLWYFNARRAQMYLVAFFAALGPNVALPAGSPTRGSTVGARFLKIHAKEDFGCGQGVGIVLGRRHARALTSRGATAR